MLLRESWVGAGRSVAAADEEVAAEEEEEAEAEEAEELLPAACVENETARLGFKYPDTRITINSPDFVPTTSRCPSGEKRSADAQCDEGTRH